MASIMKYVITQPYLDIGCQLGEAPFFDSINGVLRFVDNIMEKLHIVEIGESPRHVGYVKLPCAAASTADIERYDQRLVFGAKYGFAFMVKYKPFNGMLRRWKNGVGFNYGIYEVKGKMIVQSNCAAVNSMGRYWIGLTG